MFSEILKIIPKIDSKELAQMERNLTSRFTKVAKKFGSGVANVFKGGGVAGAALALIDKLLNPLKEVQESIDRTLKSSDDVVTNAKQFETTSGKLFKLISLAKGAGLGQDDLFMLLTKFQTAIAEAKQNPSAPSAVKNFTNEKDTAQGFFDFIQSLQKMEKSQQILVQQAVFGEKQILKMSDFLNSDFSSLFKEVGLDKVSSKKLTGSIEKLGGLNDLADVLTAKREVTDIVAKGGAINEGMIRARDKAERVALERENMRIKSYEDLQAISSTVDKIMVMVEQGLGLLGKLISVVTPALNSMVSSIEKFSKGPMARGLMKLFGKGD